MKYTNFKSILKLVTNVLFEYVIFLYVTIICSNYLTSVFIIIIISDRSSNSRVCLIADHVIMTKLLITYNIHMHMHMV